MTTGIVYTITVFVVVLIVLELAGVLRMSTPWYVPRDQLTGNHYIDRALQTFYRLEVHSLQDRTRAIAQQRKKILQQIAALEVIADPDCQVKHFRRLRSYSPLFS